MIRVDPLTFEFFTQQPLKVGEFILDEIKRGTKFFQGSELAELNNFLLNLFISSERLNSLPSDTRFPGFFSSITDHTISTSAIAVSMALDLYNKEGEDYFSSEYEGELRKMLRDEKELKEVVRVASILHDIGKHPPERHYERTRKYAAEILRTAGFESVAEDIAVIASRHHYREGLDYDFKPKTRLEWVVAIADNVAVGDRIIFPSPDTLSPYEWLSKVVENGEKAKIDQLLEYIRGRRDADDELTKILPVKMETLQRLDNKVFNPENIFSSAVEIGVLCVEVAGIQKFINASDYRKYISGASMLIENTLQEVRREIENLVSPECVVYAKGGSLLALVPSEYYDRVRKLILEIFERRTATVSPKLPPREQFSYSLSELKYGPKIFHSDKGSVDDRNFGKVVSRTLSFLETGYSIGRSWTARVGELCPSCYEFKKEGYKKKIDDKEEEVCRRCYLVLEEHDRREAVLFEVNLQKLGETGAYLENEFTKKVRDKFVSKLNRDPVLSELNMRGVESIVFRQVKTWDHLGRQHFLGWMDGKDEEVYDIAFIKGDGDNFGKIKENASSITLFRHLSKLLEEVIEDSIAEALSDVLLTYLKLVIKLYEGKNYKLELELPYDIVFIGGDDFMLLLDPAFLFVFLKVFRRNVIKLLGEKRDEYSKELGERLSIVSLGVSLGVAIVKNRIPVKSTINSLNKMLDEAKNLSKSDSRKFGGEIYLYIQKFDQLPTREEVESTKRYKAFPMTGEEFEEFVSGLRFFVESGVSPNWIERIFGKRKPESEIEACINLLFKKARTNKESKEFEVLDRIWKMHGQFAGEVRFKHIDLADFLKILTERLREKFSDEEVVEVCRLLVGD